MLGKLRTVPEQLAPRLPLVHLIVHPPTLRSALSVYTCYRIPVDTGYSAMHIYPAPVDAAFGRSVEIHPYTPSPRLAAPSLCKKPNTNFGEHPFYAPG